MLLGLKFRNLRAGFQIKTIFFFIAGFHVILLAWANDVKPVNARCNFCFNMI